MKKSAWTILKDKREDIEKFSKDYIKFLTYAKTERRVVKFVEEAIKGRDDIFVIKNHGKTIALYRKGKKSIKEGVRVVAAHIDAPRIDLKPITLYEDEASKVALLDTHYYGGIKKYQWVNRELAIIGVVVKEDGTVIEVEIGDKPEDPAFVIPDLLPHLAREQMKKNASEVVPGEKLDLIAGSYYEDTEEKEGEKKEKFSIKKYILNILKEKYGIEEEDLVSADLEIVPAGPAREVGFDRSLIGGYGHDDRVCAYTGLRAFLEVEEPEHPILLVLYDKEEIGSYGNTGAHSVFLEYVFAEVINYEGLVPDVLTLRKVLNASEAISADVDAVVNPLWKEVHELRDAAFIGHGIVVAKYTGSGGKFFSNEAHAEYVAKIRRIFNKHNVPWQIAELGKVDAGGGGTVAFEIAKFGINVIDAGPGVMSMHSPFELLSKADLYSAYLAYKAFFKEE